MCPIQHTPYKCANIASRKEATKHAPIEDVKGTDADDKFKNPIVTETDEAGNVAKKDGQFKHTARIASHVRQPMGDEYGMKARSPSHTTNSAASVSKRPSTLEKMQARTDSGANSSRKKGTEKAHVLLVEDNVINQRILKRKLESKKFRVTTANNGREAVDSVKNNLNPEDGSERNPADSSDLFDVILMDQEMPVLDGNAATKEIRRLEDEGRVMRVPILGVTANVREAQKDEMKSAGMDDVISKPYSMEDLIGRIDRLVQHERESQSREADAKEANPG
jgi:CheY-like chemotaxis protein